MELLDAKLEHDMELAERVRGVRRSRSNFGDSASPLCSHSDQQMLTAYFYNQRKSDLEKNFILVDRGTGVLLLQVALTNASAATRGLRSASVVIPQLRVVNAAQSPSYRQLHIRRFLRAEMKATECCNRTIPRRSDRLAGRRHCVSAEAQWQWATRKTR